MANQQERCVILADRHHGVTEGVRGLLETTFDTVVMVADEHSLFEIANRLHPTLAVVDLSLARKDSLRWLRQLRESCPALKILALSVYDEPSVRLAALESGADGLVLKRNIATELLPAIDALLAKTSHPPKARGSIKSAQETETPMQRGAR